jgi:hypothetical protein
MKRNSITAIIDKCMQLTIRCSFNGLQKLNISRIKKAAVNEIIRLNAEESMERIAGIDFQSGVDDFLGAVKTICDEYNQEVLGGCPRKEERP